MEPRQIANWHVQVCCLISAISPYSDVHRMVRHGVDSFTGLTAPQTKALAEKAHVYMTADGRISMAGLNSGNIKYFAESVDAAVRGEL